MTCPKLKRNLWNQYSCSGFGLKTTSSVSVIFMALLYTEFLKKPMQFPGSNLQWGGESSTIWQRILCNIGWVRDLSIWFHILHLSGVQISPNSWWKGLINHAWKWPLNFPRSTSLIVYKINEDLIFTFFSIQFCNLEKWVCLVTRHSRKLVFLLKKKNWHSISWAY